MFNKSLFFSREKHALCLQPTFFIIAWVVNLIVSRCEKKLSFLERIPKCNLS